MTKPVKKLSAILFIIILLPILFISFREISSLNENESVIESIYTKQLDVILFSVNQYSQDVARSWLTRIQSMVDESKSVDKLPGNEINKLFQNSPAIDYLFIADSVNSENIVYARTPDNYVVKKNFDIVKATLNYNKQIVTKLLAFKSSKFSKIWPLVDSTGTDQLMIFILDNRMVGGFAIKKNAFVRQNLSSILQSIGKDEFVVTVFDVNTNSEVYSTERKKFTGYQQKKNLWLIPDYSLSIALKGKTLHDLIKSRAYNNLFMILGLSVLMICFSWFAYRNFRQEIELAQIKSDFVSNVSHELRTPLALINMFAETLSMGRVKSEEKRDEYYNIIQEETDRLSKIVNRILNFSKIESGKWKYNFEKHNLNELTEKIYGNYKFHLRNKGFEFIYESADEMKSTELDKEAVSEAVINLLDNAVKYSADTKKVIMRTGTNDGYVYVEVEDSGIGIAGDDQKKIFDKFYRVTTEDVHNTKGTGLGLTLVKHIVDAHNGEIKLTSKLGKGTLFRLSFPVLKFRKEI
jgi:two-component system, OmpR family, phosphate regulon sensor histidine kinase PhoR